MKITPKNFFMMKKAYKQMFKQKHETPYSGLSKAIDTGKFSTYTNAKKWGLVVASAIALFILPIAASGQSFALQGAVATNPFNPAGTPIDIGNFSAPTFVDIDNDGDFDFFMGTEGGTIRYYQNTGSSTNPAFTEQTGINNPFDGVDVGSKSVPTCVDIDNDGDFDAFIGSDDGTIKYYQNTGNVTTPTFVEQTGSNNPLNVDVGNRSVPTFVDINSDGDLDAFIGESFGTIKYYQNTGTTTNPTFVLQTGGSNPLNMDVGDNSAPTFVDIDSDGDFDAIIGTSGGTIFYYKNTGNSATPTFVSQTGSSNPFTGINLQWGVPTFVDIDNEGNLDACIGASSGQIYYLENTSPTCSSTWLSASDMLPKDKYLNFDGVNDNITAIQQTTVANNFTMEFWARPTATITIPAQAASGLTGLGGQRYVIHPNVASQAGAGVSVGTNGVCVLEHGDGYIPVVLSWAGTISGWTHIAVVYTNQVPTLYINGVLTATGVDGAFSNVYPTTTDFGGGQYGYFQGDLDELRIWDNALSAATILANKDVELTGNEAGLIDYYKFNEGNLSGTNTGLTTLTDATTTANDGTLNNNFALIGATSNWYPFFSSTLSPPSSQNISFDGENDKITATQQSATANNFTMEFWAKPTGTITLHAQSTSGTLGTLGQRFAIFPTLGSAIAFSPNDACAGVSVGTNGVCVLEHGDGYLPSLLTWEGTISGWTHIAVVYTGKQPSLYINGILVSTGLTSLKNSVYPTTTSYGGGQYGYFKGSMDELRIWNTPLSAANILARKDIELAGNEAGLMDYYKFNQGTAFGNNTGVTTLIDATTTNNNGTLVGFKLTGSISNWSGIEGVAITSDDADDVIVEGTSVTFTATINSGVSGSYKWTKNGVSVGTNSYTYTDATLVNGDEITVEMSNYNICPLSVTSNSITMTVTAAPLPVELLSFTATAQDNRTNLLEWQTASEENNEGFDIERSKDGRYFEKIGYVKGNGTTVEVFNYNFIDENPINGINYYRLKQMDFDGQFEYSKIVNVNLFSTNNTITIYPNPVRDELTVTNTENVENVAIYNAIGQVVKQFAVNAEQLKINVSDLQEGIYTLRLQTKNGTMITKQFVK